MTGPQINIPQPSGVPYDAYNPEQWRQILLTAHSRLMQDPHNPRWLQAIQDANTSLNKHTQLSAQPTSIGQDVGDVATGAWNAAKGIPRGIGTMLGQLGQGDFVGAGKTVVGGLANTAKGAMAPWELAMNELSGVERTPAERSNMLQQGGAAVTGLEAMALPGQIGRGLSALRGGGPTPGIPPIEEPPTPQAPASPPPPIDADWSYAQEPTIPKQLPPATTPVEPTPAGATPAQPAMEGFRNAQPIPDAGLNAAGAPRGISVEGPETPPATPAMDALSKMTQGAGRVAGQKGVTFGPESPLDEAAQAGVKDLLGQISRSSPEAGFTTPEMLALMVALGGRLGLGSGALGALKGLDYGGLAKGAVKTGLGGAGMSPDSTR